MYEQSFPIKFRKDFVYDKVVPTFVSNNVGGHDEIARWVLDLNDTLYIDEPHAPGFYVSAARKLTKDNLHHGPVFIKTDALIYSTESIIQYIDESSHPDKRLLPDDPTKRKEVLDLYNLFTGEFVNKVFRYVSAHMLPYPHQTRAVFTQRVPWIEKIYYKLRYPYLRKTLIREMNLENSPDDLLPAITSIFQKVDNILSDGRKFLTGDSLTIADIAFASISAPLILPQEFGGVMPMINQVPEALQQNIFSFRATPSGQFTMSLYQKDRPVMRSQSEIPPVPNAFAKFLTGILIRLGRGKSNLFYSLQKRFPVLKFPFIKILTVNRNDLLVELMQRDEDFTVEEINAKKMAHQKGAFFLGMDRTNPQFDRERNFVRKSTTVADLEVIRAYVRSTSEEIVERARVLGKIDVADTLCRVVLVRLIEQYFGVPGPTEYVMKEWLRALFYDLFLNFTNNKKRHEEAVIAATARKDWILELIETRKQDVKDGKKLDDNVLNRLIIMQQEEGNEWFDDDTLQRNMGGLITGILETTNKAVIFVLDELFNRPDALRGAIKTAQSGDMKKMYGYVSEALRFNPVQPGVLRYSEKPQVIKGKGNKEYTIPAHAVIFALTSAAMFDPAAFPEPKKFNPEREAVYMNYGFALHECYGRYINAVTISEFVAAILRLENVQREDASTGRGTGLHIGPFPNNFVVTFDQAD